MTIDKEIIISIFNPEKEHFVKLPSNLVTECMNYLNGKLVSAEVMSEIKNLKDQDPTLSKTEIVEYILDHQERILKALNKK